MSGLPTATACLALADGSVFHGRGFGATGEVAGRLVFSSAMSGYQEALTDPASLGAITIFTFPHIGNTGTTPADDESRIPHPGGLVTRWLPTAPSSWRAAATFNDWLAGTGRIGIGGVDTRRLTRLVREGGSLAAILAHDPAGVSADDLVARARALADAAPAESQAASPAAPRWWRDTDGDAGDAGTASAPAARKVVVVDLGVKESVLRLLAALGCRVRLPPADASADDIINEAPDGILLSGGPGDPAAIADRMTPVINAVLAAGIPLFGIGLGHQLMGLALGARVVRLAHGHHGTNHPVRSLAEGRVRITTMNNDFAIDGATLPPGVEATHVSMFDDSNCGLKLVDRPAFSVQFLAEGAPGPHDERHLFRRFVDMIDEHRAA